jgi:hypothetical protein
MELEVEEDAKAQARELFNGSRALGGKELASYFDDVRRPPKPACQCAGRPQPGDIQCDDYS